MIDAEELDIPTTDGTAHAFVYGGGLGKRPGVLLYTDAFGVRPAVQEMASRLAGLGYLVLLPDIFYRAGAYAPFDARTVWSTPPERDRLMALIHSVTPERAAIDGGAYLAALASRSDVLPDRIAALGYCMGGRLAFLAAGQHPGQVRAAALFHAGGLVSDGPASPHLLASRVEAALYLGVADADASCTPAHQGTLAEALGAAHLDYRLELYPGKKHGFAVLDSPVHDGDASERHWRRVEVFFREALA